MIVEVYINSLFVSCSCWRLVWNTVHTVYCINILFVTRDQIMVAHSFFFLHILVEAMALSPPVGVKRTMKISALQMVNTQSFAPHSSPVINLCHNFDTVHVTLLTLYVQKNFSQISCSVYLPCAKCKCLLAACFLGAERNCRVSGDRPPDALDSLICFREPLCVEADHPTPPQHPACLILEDNCFCMVAVRLLRVC